MTGTGPELKSPLRINNDSITIAGQSAPGAGICLKDYPLVINASNVIIRYLRVRVGDRYHRDSDGIGGGRYGQKNVILDHLSSSWSIDECLSIYKTENLTVQWCLVSHSLNKSVHTKGSHGFGGIWGGYKATFHHNLLANHASRNPRFASVDGTKWVDYRNNVVYNWGYKTAYGGGHHGEINIVGNYYKPGPASQHHRILDVADDGTGRDHVHGNVMEGDPKVTLDKYKSAIDDRPGKPYIPTAKNKKKTRGIAEEAIPARGEESASLCIVDTPFPYEAIDEDEPDVAYRRVLANAGCSRVRDSYDKAVIEQVKKGFVAHSEKKVSIRQPRRCRWLARVEVAEAPQRQRWRTRMPDRWEKRNGLNPLNPNDASTYTISREYTNVECYLNSLVDKKKIHKIKIFTYNLLDY